MDCPIAVSLSRCQWDRAHFTFDRVYMVYIIARNEYNTNGVNSEEIHVDTYDKGRVFRLRERLQPDSSSVCVLVRATNRRLQFN